MMANSQGPLDYSGMTSPYVAAIPRIFRQGDSPTWVDTPFIDVNGVQYDAGTHTLKYTLAGPITTPLVLTAAAIAGSNNWQNAITTTQSNALTAGKYWWTAQLFATGFRLTIAEGELKVELDLANAGANYDERTVAEKALTDAEAALATFTSSGGRVQEYMIGSRRMMFQRDSDLLAVVLYWRRQVRIERSKAKGGADRLILQRFRNAR